MIIALCLIFIFLSAVYFKLNLYNHTVALIAPWALILILSKFNISYLHKELSITTISIILIFLIAYLFGTTASRFSRASKIAFDNHHYSNSIFLLLFTIYLALTFLNIILAGYIPIIRLIQTGNSGYMDFGLSGLYGLYNAYANALAAVAFFIFLKTKDRKYLAACLTVLAFFFAFISRQNIISTLIEMFIIYGITKKRIPTPRILIYCTLLLLAFSFVGDMRSGDILNISEARYEYSNLPSAFYWVYSYLYISAVNLNNYIIYSGAPFYDGNSLYNLIPRFIRAYFGATAEYESYLEKINFTVSTSLKSIYGDFGYSQTILTGLIAGFFTNKLYKQSKISTSLKSTTTYSVLYFCSLFSFFTNFWFFLPVIFQIPFIYVFSSLIIKKNPTPLIKAKLTLHKPLTPNK
ncbi:oligosaccharide repeat unit polymerase [compost metagenome]